MLTSGCIFFIEKGVKDRRRREDFYMVASSLYQKVTRTSEDFFGPSGPHFIGKVVQNHLHKDPKRLTKHDMPELIVWLRLAVAMVIKDRRVIAKFISRLDRLSASA